MRFSLGRRFGEKKVRRAKARLSVKDQSYQFLKLRNRFCSPSKTSVRVG